KAWAVQWSPDSAFETRTSNGSFTHAFHDTGTQELKAFVKDDDGLTSDTVEVTVYVKLGAPFVISVNASSPTGTSIFILDTIRFTLRGDDPNGHIDSALVWWNGDTGSTAERVKAANDSAVFTHVFGRNENGNRTSRFRVMDDDKLTKDFVVTRMVRLGSPVVTSARCERDTIWVNDAYKYYVSASDTNGFIRKIYANWEGGDAAQDSLMISGNRASIDTFFTHAYDTSGGAKTTRFKTIDEDTVASAFRDTAFTVRKGAPALWGDTDDTLWVAVDEGYRDYYYKPNYRDTNGTIQKFYFGASADTGAASYKGPADSAVYTVSALTIDVGDYRYIYALDDDGLLRGERFVVFPDSAPPRPASFISSTISDSTILKWEKVLDTKDGVKTQVQIFIKEGSSGEPDVPLFAEPLPTIDDPRFGEETISTLHATYKFKCSFSGLGRWRVVLRDARGTESIAPNTAGDPATFVAP
ncbi:MAG: hypothetical protein JXA18_04190, partial [Chitinispirillaceae bacterium]|nr:hypothetical protein [Chitinispirillaceae bacterium]